MSTDTLIRPRVEIAEDRSEADDVLGVGSLNDATPEEIQATRLRDISRTEAFMHELVTVYIHESTNENDPPHGILSVNGVNQPFMRGVEQTMKRKYVEVLLRMRETKFSQPMRDMMNPESGNRLIPRSADVYPFEVVEDSRAGREWMRRIRSEIVQAERAAAARDL